MSDKQNDPDSIHLVQQLFNAVRSLPPSERAAWLEQECGDDDKLQFQVERLLAQVERTSDPLEDGLSAFSTAPAGAAAPVLSDAERFDIDLEAFLSRLSAAGLMSEGELRRLSDDTTNTPEVSDPHQLASQLVSLGKITQYQASALIRGEPELLIDKYLILDLLDVGGMGMVFKAIHRPMNRAVAIKMISPKLLSSKEQIRRFQREVRVAASLEHENIVRAYDADQSKGLHFLVMEYVRGENLSRLVAREGPLTVERAVNCIRQAASGLRYAGKNGVIHRDIKPGNLMQADDGLVKVLDLGLAGIDESLRLSHESSTAQDAAPESDRPESDLTRPGMVLGTVAYMAPEQALDAGSADTRSDIYSLGCTLYFLLTGETPYRGKTVFEMFVEHRDADPPSVRKSRPDVPKAVDDLTRKMLAKRPDDRFQSMSELIAVIDDCDLKLPQRVAKQRPEPRRTDVRAPAQSGGTTTNQRIPSGGKGKFSIAVGAVLVLAAAIALSPLIASWTEPAPEDGRTAAEREQSEAASGRAGGVSKSTPTVAEMFASGKWRWSEPKNMGVIVNSPRRDMSPTLPKDESYIIFNSHRRLGAATTESPNSYAWIARRNESKADELWSEPLPLENIRSAIKPRLSLNGKLIAFDDDTPLIPQPANPKVRDFDLFLGTRQSTNDPFDEVERLGENINSLGRSEMCPSLSGDGLILLYSRVPLGENGPVWAEFQVAMCERDSSDQPFGQPRDLSFFDREGNAVMLGQNCLSADGLHIYGVVEDGQMDLAVTSRRSLDEPFGPVVPLESINTESVERTPFISADGKTLWFASDRPGGNGDLDIWVSMRIESSEIE